MTGALTREEIIDEALRLAHTQSGGTLATMHAEDGTPYVSFVLFHLRDDGLLLFGSGISPQHTRNMQATPEVSFLIDNREIIRNDWAAFDRVVIEGRSERIEQADPRYKPFLDELSARNLMAAYFTEHGHLYCIVPRRLIFMRGFEPARHIVEFDEE
jgi:nitroimidazol reductase NimA-like FMN-containing flavoprotein (pyridoxamine 5'-phosphate oxidase superfamily)